MEDNLFTQKTGSMLDSLHRKLTEKKHILNYKHICLCWKLVLYEKLLSACEIKQQAKAWIQEGKGSVQIQSKRGWPHFLCSSSVQIYLALLAITAPLSVCVHEWIFYMHVSMRECERDRNQALCVCCSTAAMLSCAWTADAQKRCD